MSRLVKELENKSFMQSKLVFADNVISSCFIFFLLVIDLCFLILSFIAQIFNSSVELAREAKYWPKKQKQKWIYIQ